MEPCSETKPTKPLAEIDLEGCSYGHGDLLSSTTPDKGHGGWKTLLLAYKTLGVVFGGLVTSPLYVYPSMNLKSPSGDDYLGILSIMFWTLTLIGVAKYVCIALNADDHGEGGTFALYSLLCRHVNIGVLSNPTRQVDPLLGLSHKSWYRNTETHSRMGRFIEKSVVARRILLFIAMLGMRMLIGDGILPLLSQPHRQDRCKAKYNFCPNSSKLVG